MEEIISKSPEREFLVLLERTLVNPVDDTLHYELVPMPLRKVLSDTAYLGNKEI